jgi:outer membrane receptor protein involved in Fe transport
MKYSIVLSFLIFIVLVVNAKPSAPVYLVNEVVKDGSIKGKVYDAGIAKPMEFTSLALYSASDSTLLTGTISDNDGSFTLKNIPFGKYYLVANFMGYEKYFVDGIILTDRKSTVDLGIIKLVSSSQDLDEIEVVAVQKRVEYKIDRKVINVSQDLNAAGGSAVDVLQNTPSVTVDIDGNVSLRGSTNFTVLIDGRPSPLAGNDALQQIPATSIENIEIITNPSAKFDPDGMAGILNIVTKKNTLQGLSGIFNTSIGTKEKYSGDFLLSFKTKKYNVFGGMDYQNNKNFGSMYSLRTINPGGPLSSLVSVDGNRNQSRKGLSLKGGVDLYLNEKSTLTLSADAGNHGHNSEMLTNMHSYTIPASYDTFDIAKGIGIRNGDYYNLNVNYIRKFDEPQHELQASLSYQGEKGDDSDEESEFPANELYQLLPLLPASRVRSTEAGDEVEFRANVDYTRPVSEKGLLETGYQIRIDKQNEGYMFENYDPDTDKWTNNPLYSSSNLFNRNIQAVYATFSNSLGKFEYKAGLRSEYTNQNIRKEVNSTPYSQNLLDFFPSLHLSRQFKGEQQVLTSYSRRINRAGGGDLEPFRNYVNSYTLREGNPNLKPEYVNSFELSYQKNIGNSFFVVESYFRNTQNLITRMMYQDPALPNIVIMSVRNINSDNSIGAELMINLAAKKWLTLNSTVNVYKYWLDGIMDGVKIEKKSNNWDMRLNATAFFSTKSRIQANIMYNGPSVTAQGNRGAFYFANIAYRQDFLDRKLSATIAVQDIFGTMKHEFSTYSPALNSTMRFEREHQVVTLTLSYKLNNFKNQNEDREESESTPEDASGGFQ